MSAESGHETTQPMLIDNKYFLVDIQMCPTHTHTQYPSNPVEIKCLFSFLVEGGVHNRNSSDASHQCINTNVKEELNNIKHISN